MNLLCATCGVNKRTRAGAWRGKVYYKGECWSCSTNSYRRHRKDKCERCGFVPEHACQLDVDHKDGDRENNDPSNLQTLCANCHRLKTITSGDHLPERRVEEGKEDLFSDAA